MLRGNRELWRTFWKYTTLILGNEVVWGIGFTMGSVIIGHLGSDAVAANAVANVTKNLLTVLPLVVFSVLAVIQSLVLCVMLLSCGELLFLWDL